MNTFRAGGAMILWLGIAGLIVNYKPMNDFVIFALFVVLTDYINIMVTKCNAEAKPEFHSMFSGYSDAGATFRSLLPKKTKSK